jgi:glutamate 5-kinase
MSLWDQLFSHMRQPVAQILLTRNDIADRTQYLNAQNTFFQLMDMGVIPIVNENDTLAVTEIKFGDNDTLSAITAGMVHADYLFLMTDVDCLYDKNPRTNPDAKPIEIVEDIDELDADVSSRGSSLGVGGMFTKIVAARRATSVGVTTVITRSSRPGNIWSIVQYAQAQKALKDSTPGTPTKSPPFVAVADTAMSAPSTPDPSRNSVIKRSPPLHPTVLPPLHTCFLPAPRPIRDHHFWLLHIFAPSGNIYIDENAHAALKEKANLFPVGIVHVDGNFAQQEAVRIFLVKRLPRAPGEPKSFDYEKTDPAPVEVGRAVVNYSSVEIKLIKGLQATEISGVLGYADSEYVAFRENIAFFKTEKSRPGTPSAVDYDAGEAEGKTS